jgi:hypothetical protein
MERAALSLEQAPPLSVPARFFLTAPLFGVAAALLMLWAGPGLLASRWTPALLGVTHLLTLGFIAMVMVGAMFQLLPVLGGASLRRPRAFSVAVHLLLSAGTLLLAIGLAAGCAYCLRAALPLLGAGLAVFIVLAATALRRSPSQHASVKAMGFAVAGLGVTLLLGLYVGAGHGWTALPAARRFTDLHLSWGLLGWVGLLGAGVAYQVVPMFQMTPEYPAVLRRWLVPALFATLLLLSAALLWPDVLPALLRVTAEVLLAAGFVLFAAWTLSLQARRRRHQPDVTLWFWRLGMACVIAGALLWAARQLHGDAGWDEARYPVLLGVLLIPGFAVSIVSGMLYKILPFLVWLHLQTQAASREERRRIPNTKEIIADRDARLQFALHALALALLAGAALWPRLLTYPAALAFATACALLWLNLARGLRTYRAVQRGFGA